MVPLRPAVRQVDQVEVEDEAEDRTASSTSLEGVRTASSTSSARTVRSDLPVARQAIQGQALGRLDRRGRRLVEAGSLDRPDRPANRLVVVAVFLAAVFLEDPEDLEEDKDHRSGGSLRLLGRRLCQARRATSPSRSGYGHCQGGSA